MLRFGRAATLLEGSSRNASKWGAWCRAVEQRWALVIASKLSILRTIAPWTGLRSWPQCRKQDGRRMHEDTLKRWFRGGDRGRAGEGAFLVLDAAV